MKTRSNITAIIRDKKGRVLSIGKNSYEKTHPKMAALSKRMGEPHKVYLHAEIAAIIRCRNLSKAWSIEVYRINKGGSWTNAKPCPICQEAIKQVGIQKVFYTEGGA